MTDKKIELSPGLLQLDPSDNVVVILRDFDEGDTVVLDRISVAVPRDLAMGHKLALRPIIGGEDVIKYGAPIGVAAGDIAVGDHVHLHNVTSRYTVIQDVENDHEAG